MEETVKRLEAQLKLAQDRCTEFEKGRTEAQAASATGGDVSGASYVYHSKPEKNLKKFKEGDDINDWVDIAQRYINKLKNESEKVDLILNFLDKKPLIELKFLIHNRDKTTSSEVFKILKDVYGLKDTWERLEKKFYSRDQEDGETLQDYSHALMEILLDMEKMNTTSSVNTDRKLKDRFADGVNDVSLSRELDRLNRERPRLKFFELRDEAKNWCRKSKDNNAEKEDTVTESISAQQSDNVLKLLQDQQLQIQHLTEAVETYQYRGRGRSRGRSYDRGRGRSRGQYWNNNQGTNDLGRGRSRGQYWNNNQGTNEYQSTSTPQITDVQPDFNRTKSSTEPTDNAVICYYCKLPNHTGRNCIKRRQDLRKKSSNFSHSR